MKRVQGIFVKTLCAVTVLGAAAYGQIDIPSDGSDGALNIINTTGNCSLCMEAVGGATSCNSIATCTIDLGQAAAGLWDDPSPVTGKGVYDSEKWAVVYKYTTVTVAGGKTVAFKNHPSGAPVVWLVQGNVTIDGIVSLVGGNSTGGLATASIPGPGGFRGGAAPVGATLGSSGFGPGGADLAPTNAGGSGGSYGTLGGGAFAGELYGNGQVIPLIGGSGGAAVRDSDGVGSGSGGGAILIAAGLTFLIGNSGRVHAFGGNGSNGPGGAEGAGGSGGAIRIVAETTAGGGQLLAREGFPDGGGFYGGKGRIRVESNMNLLTHPGDPAYSHDIPSDPPMIWPPDNAPKLTPVEFSFSDGQPNLPVPFPFDPHARLDFPNTDLSFGTVQEVTLHIAAENVPLDWVVKVRVVPKAGDPLNIVAAPLVGDDIASTTIATFTMPMGFAAIQLRADDPTP